MTSLSKWRFMKDVVWRWVLKGIADLMGRENDGGRAFQKERPDQPKQRPGVQRVHGMFRGHKYPIGARMWDILGSHWGQIDGGDKMAKEVGPRSCRSPAPD